MSWLNKMHHDQMSMTLSALADPTRRAILSRLTSGDANVNELARPFDMTVQAVSRHIRVLEDAGLISRRRDAQSRICRLKPQNLEAVDGWLASYRHFWNGSFDRMETILKVMADAPDGSDN